MIRPHSTAAKVAFVTLGTVAAVAVAGLAVATFTGVVPVLVAVIAAGMIAAWLYGLARLISLALDPNLHPVSLDCRDGKHGACDGCTCTCTCHRP